MKPRVTDDLDGRSLSDVGYLSRIFFSLPVPQTVTILPFDRETFLFHHHFVSLFFLLEEETRVSNIETSQLLRKFPSL